MSTSNTLSELSTCALPAVRNMHIRFSFCTVCPFPKFQTTLMSPMLAVKWFCLHTLKQLSSQLFIDDLSKSPTLTRRSFNQFCPLRQKIKVSFFFPGPMWGIHNLAAWGGSSCTYLHTQMSRRSALSLKHSLFQLKWEGKQTIHWHQERWRRGT